ncbi:hypothetical protein C8A03DRAFT_42494 [Achaetomium macrosporum]|uniref:Uncharacterized protein n=1 Tax=Achaetomium macrosporum TaxID=79813 RepID=A0AAN7CDB7_9PEZI|nr:hypothetical protein C8A03DRAFT_42494 [Achaetomium macrosporum]
MCIGIIGHCSCVHCIDQPIPGKLLRIEFCKEQQDRLVGIWRRFSPLEPTIVPCAKVTFNRVLDSNGCHFKGSKIETEQKVTAPVELSVEPAVVAPWFTSTNQPTAVRDREEKGNNGNDTQATPQAGPDCAQKEARTGTERTQDTAEPKKDTPLFPTIAFTPINAPATRTAAVAASEGRTPATAVANTATPTPAPAPVPEKKAEDSAVTAPAKPDSKRRTPLPITGRPRSPAPAREVEGARADRGPWTCEETVKLLLLKSKGLGYDEMKPWLPGRDEGSCIDRITGLAVKYGYEDYID